MAGGGFGAAVLDDLADGFAEGVAATEAAEGCDARAVIDVARGAGVLRFFRIQMKSVPITTQMTAATHIQEIAEA